MTRIAISYRRADTGQIVGRISDWLAERYGKDSVFVDVDNIPYGVDFRSHIHEVLLKTDVLVAAIGDDWLGRRDAGQSRMLQETDPVRVEIETALERKVTIIPVLIDGAKMPGVSELPPTFGDFAYLNAPAISSGRDFRTHMERLIVAIDRIAGKGGAASASSVPVPALSGGGTEGPPAADQLHHSDWRADTLRYFVAPLIALLVVHYAVVNSFDLNTLYLRVACVVVPLAFGFALFLIARRGAGAAAAFGLALGLAGVVGMTVSESLYSGDPMMPQSRFEWLDNLQFAGTIVLSFIVGHLAARVARALMRRKRQRRNAAMS